MNSKIENVLRWRNNHPIEARAIDLLVAYNKSDKKYNRGRGDLTAKWMVEHILTKPCAHCGKSGWKAIGCNRLDNSKPHTMDNVEPCCQNCNAKLRGKDTSDEQSIAVYQYTTDGELIKKWKNAYIASEELGFSQGGISTCCRGGYFSKSRGKFHTCNTYKGYKWSYTPL